MKQVFEKGTKIQVVHSTSDNWYRIREIYTVHSYLEHKDAYVVEEDYDKWRDTAWIDAKDVEMYVDWYTKEQLPPVGTEFEYSFGNGYWFKATSTYVVGDSGVVALCETMESVVEQYLDNEECEFRPIKSKEQQNKEEAIAEMVKVADPSGHLYNTASLFCERLFNAGWRKVE